MEDMRENSIKEDLMSVTRLVVAINNFLYGGELSMDKVQLVFYIVLVLIPAVAAIIPSVIWLIKKVRQLIVAPADEKQDIVNEIYDNCVKYVVAAEQAYSLLNASLKMQNESAGKTKLSYVLDKIKIDCLDKGVTYDESYWTNKVNNLVEMSKTVNVVK